MTNYFKYKSSEILFPPLENNLQLIVNKGKKIGSEYYICNYRNKNKAHCRNCGYITEKTFYILADIQDEKKIHRIFKSTMK